MTSRPSSSPSLSPADPPRLVLVTGGAGFIGSHVADELLRCGYAVRALDNLSPQIHGEAAGRPDYLDPRVELQVGDVCDPLAVEKALHGVDVVIHLAAAVGVGQSMYALRHYTQTNDLGTATLMEALIERPVAKLVVASSMSIYGEGLYVKTPTATASTTPGGASPTSRPAAGSRATPTAGR